MHLYAFFWSFGVNNYNARAWEMFHIPLSLMNRLNKTGSVIFCFFGVFFCYISFVALEESTFTRILRYTLYFHIDVVHFLTCFMDCYCFNAHTCGIYILIYTLISAYETWKYVTSFIIYIQITIWKWLIHDIYDLN